QRARPLSKIQGQAASNRQHISAIGLPDISIHLRSQFVCSAALEGFSGLPVLKIQPYSIATLGIKARRALNQEICLAQAEAVAAHVIGTQQVHAAKGPVEVVSVIAVKGAIDGGPLEKVEHRTIFLADAVLRARALCNLLIGQR